MRAILMLGIGATFTTLAVVLPAIHASGSTGMRPETLALLSLAVAALVGAVLYPAPWLVFFGYPAAHLPALVGVEPAITGPGIYSGTTGAFALVVVASVGAAWLSVALLMPASRSEADTRPNKSSKRQRALLPSLTLVLALAVFAAFAASALGRPGVEPLAANITLIVGLVAVWFGVGRWVVGRLGDVLLDEECHHKILATIVNPKRPGRGELVAAIVVALFAVAVAVIWYTL